MPINPNIALGAQNQVQPINMLGQMGQLYALKAAKQEFEGGEALRDAFASGGDLNDPAFIQRLRAANPKMALDIEAKHLAGQKTRSELEAAAYKNTREALTMVNNPESLRAFSLSQFNDPVIGPRLKAIGLTPEIALANLDKEIATSGFETALKKASMGLDSFFKDQTSRRNTDVSSGAAYGQLALAQKKFDLEQAQQNEVNRILRGEAPTIAPATTAGPTAATPVGAGSVPTGASAPTAAPATAPTNALAPTGTAAAPTNALVTPTGDVYSEINRLDAQIRQLAGSGNPKALEAARVLNSQRNALLQSAQQQYGGPIVDMEVTDPATGQRTTVKGQRDQYGRLVPVEMGAIPLSTNASVTGGTTISPTVARPAPTAAVIKERQAIEKLPEAIAMNTDAIRKIDEMIGAVDAKGNPLPGTAGKPHPGFTGAVGAGFGTRFIPGTDAKAFEIRHKEVLSQAFLDAFEALKGGGAITEKEGEKATAARTRMDLAQNEKEYMAAAREYQGVLKRGIENARAKIQRSGGGSAENADPLGIRK